MIINQGNIDGLFRGFNTSFSEGFGIAESNYADVAMVTSSATSELTYAWLGQIPSMREWLGDRVIQNMSLHGYSIKNKKFELTIEVTRDRIEDDTYGVFGPLFTDMGQTAGRHPDQLVFGLLNKGFTTPCYDGQNFFSNAHPVFDKNGAATTVSNMTAGAGPAWFLIDNTRAVRPMIFQKRIDYQFQQVTYDDDNSVFMSDAYKYGVRARVNAGFGLWQLAYGSTDVLTPATYAAARASMHALAGDYGRPLGLRPSILVVPTILEAEAMQVLNTQFLAGGGSNIWWKTATPIITPWLS